MLGGTRAAAPGDADLCPRTSLLILQTQRDRSSKFSAEILFLSQERKKKTCHLPTFPRASSSVLTRFVPFQREKKIRAEGIHLMREGRPVPLCWRTLFKRQQSGKRHTLCQHRSTIFLSSLDLHGFPVCFPRTNLSRQALRARANSRKLARTRAHENRGKEK